MTEAESSILPTQFYIWLGYRQFSVPHEFVIIMNFYKQCVCFVLFDSCLLFRSTMKLANYVTVFFSSSHSPNLRHFLHFPYPFTSSY